MERDNLIKHKSKKFALRIIGLYKYLTKNKREFVLSKQVLRSGTSIGANIEEAEGGQSKKDFVAKMYIAYKEARETKYWLRLLDKSSLVEIPMKLYLSEIEEIIRMLTKIVKTTSENMKSNAKF